MKWISLIAVLMLLVLIVGCKSAPSGDEALAGDEAPSTTEESVDDIESDLAEIDSLQRRER